MRVCLLWGLAFSGGVGEPLVWDEPLVRVRLQWS